jgi:hypothetical protein
MRRQNFRTPSLDEAQALVRLGSQWFSGFDPVL